MLVARQIQPIITLAASSGQSFNGNDTAKYDGLRVRVNISKGGTPQLDTAEIRIWGMPLSDMNAVSRLGKPMTWTKDNLITINAGDAQAGMSQIFTGAMYSAYVDFEPPDASLNIMAISRLVELTKAVPPSSFPGNASIDTIGQAIATLMGLGFQNSGVNWQTKNVYYTGSAKAQMDAVAKAANCQWTPNGGSVGNLLEVWPKGVARGSSGITIAPPPADGSALPAGSMMLIGYPTYEDVGVGIKVLYAPGIGFGQSFTLKSSVLTGGDITTYYVYQQEINLGCNDPDGDNPWETDIVATSVDITGQSGAQAQATLGNLTG